MRAYRACWTAIVVAVTGVAAAVGWLAQSPWLLLAQTAAVAIVGGVFGATLQEDAGLRWATTRRWALRGAAIAVMLAGLPPFLGAWSLLVIAVAGLTHPSLVLVMVRRWGRRRDRGLGGSPKELSDDRLARQWRYSTLVVRSSWRTPEELVAVVQERERLLDEIERRDPDGFAQWLAGGRQAQEL